MWSRHEDGPCVAYAVAGIESSGRTNRRKGQEMTTFEKIKVWGIRGVIDYMVRRYHERRVSRMFWDNAKRYPSANPERGITVVGPISDRGSLSKTLRDFCFSLKDAGIQFQTFDLGSNSVPEEDVMPILTPREDFRIARYTHLVEMISSPVPEGIVRNRGRIVFWEFESGLEQGYPVLFERPGDIIGMSDFNYNYYRRAFHGRRNVRKILYPLRIEATPELSLAEARSRFSIPQDDFVVFYNFSYKSGIDRKNPEGAIRAFAKAFSGRQDARMVLKTVSAKEFPGRVKQLRDIAVNLGVSDRVVFVDDFLTQRDVLNLTNACDVYLSLHRAEGFGLGIAEAMSLGKPVVVTDYSSTTEFCNAGNAIPIGYSLVKLQKTENNLYNAAEDWAEPDVDEAAKALVNLYVDRDKGSRIGAVARESIFRQYSIDNFRKSVLEYLS